VEDLVKRTNPERAERLDVSVVIVNWNTCALLRDCLASIYRESESLTFEIIVVDNASADGSREMIQQEYPSAILVENKENRGFAAANNQGIRLAIGRYLLLLNPDTLILDRAIEKVVEFAESRPDCGVIGCQVWENEDIIQHTCFAFPSFSNALLSTMGLAALFPQSRVFGKETLGSWDRTSEREVDVVSGMFMLCRREAVEEVGLMDEDYFIYAEEADWCFRFWKCGWRRVFTPCARILHVDGGGKSTSQLSVPMYVQLQKSLLLFHQKNLGWFSWAATKGIYILSALLRFGAWSVLSSLPGKRISRLKVKQSAAALRFHVFRVEPSR
jgi:hypothetical protein